MRGIEGKLPLSFFTWLAFFTLATLVPQAYILLDWMRGRIDIVEMCTQFSRNTARQYQAWLGYLLVVAAVVFAADRQVFRATRWQTRGEVRQTLAVGYAHGAVAFVLAIEFVVAGAVAPGPGSAGMRALSIAFAGVLMLWCYHPLARRLYRRWAKRCRAAQRCFECGYAMSAAGSVRCPECGTLEQGPG